MTKSYKIFRVYCIIAISILCILLLTVGFLTAKYQTETAVFSSSHSVMQVYPANDGVVINLSGKIISVESQIGKDIFRSLSYTVFAPFNNLIQAIRLIFKI